VAPQPFVGRRSCARITTVRAGLTILGLVACSRDPAEAVCPDLVAGDLVVTEVRGTQSPSDLDGPWIEVFNAASSSYDLEGTKVRFRDRGGSNEIPILIRHSLTISPGEYLVLGLFLDETRPAHVDYGFLDDYSGSWKDAGAIDLVTCGAVIDQVTYDDLPQVGTYSLNGTPDAESNNLATSWCFDPMSAGTPGAANIVCP
jgi:hypothetical protein